MTRRGIAVVAAGVVLGAVAALAAVLLTRDSAEVGAGPVPRDPSGVEARTTLSPRITLFGDTVRAHVDVTLDRDRVDPDSVRVTAQFAPWEVVGTPELVRRDAGRATFLRTTYMLRCLTTPCIPTGQAAPREFVPARVTFRSPGEDAGRDTVAARWPVLLVYSRFASASLQRGPTRTIPWRADLVSMPEATYRIAPGVLLALLLAGAALAGVAAVGLAFLAWPRRAPAPPPEPEPEPEPEPALSPLELALFLLEESVRVDGAADQRRALELVAEELELAEWGDTDLASTARSLAWSEGVPPVSETNALAARVRASIEAAQEEEEHVNGDGSVV